MFGIAQTVVKPPWAAAARPVATVSASSLPGSRRWAWRSMNPGATTTPSAPMPVGVRARQPGHGRQDPVADDDLAGSFAARRRVDQPGPADLEVGPLTGHAALGPRVRPGQQVEQRHPDRHAVGDLVGDDRLGAGRHVGGDLDALVHRSRVHDQRARPGQRQALAGQPVAGGVLAQRRQQPGGHPLALDPQGHDDVGVAQRLVHRGRDVEAPAGGALRGRPMPRTRARSVAGPHSHRSAPAAVSVQMLERATREWSRSPRMTTLRPGQRARRAGARASCTGRAAPGSGGRASRRRR